MRTLDGPAANMADVLKEACKNQEENINVLFNTLNDTMKELAEQ